MPTLNSEIKNIVAGDNLDVIRTVGNLPGGQTLVKAWFTVRRRTTSANFTFQKAITTSVIVGQGQITDIGTSGVATIRFDLQPADTVLLTFRKVFFFDIQVKTDLGRIFTPELGRIRAEVQRTITVT